ncbi:hypothetical protein DFH27DRAFT_617316 [Peziza echinospora]|nr:hypothetical protein DFH27DRAFT_617316 [Peziza echinospora]
MRIATQVPAPQYSVTPTIVAVPQHSGFFHWYGPLIQTCRQTSLPIHSGVLLSCSNGMEPSQPCVPFFFIQLLLHLLWRAPAKNHLACKFWASSQLADLAIPLGDPNSIQPIQFLYNDDMRVIAPAVVPYGAAPLHNLTGPRKSKDRIPWGRDEEAFRRLKHALTEATIIAIPELGNTESLTYTVTHPRSQSEPSLFICTKASSG